MIWSNATISYILGRFTWLNAYALGVLVLILAAQFFYRFSSGRLAGFLSKIRFHIFLRWIWILSGVVIFGTFLYWSKLQYELWGSGGFTKYMLPPYQSISYFLSYVGVRFWGPWIIAFLASYLVSRAARFLNRRFGERFFENEEIELIALGVFLTGYPGFFIYLSLILILGVISSAVYQILARGRLPLYFFWMSMAIFAIIIKDWLIPAMGWYGLISGFSLGDFFKLWFGI